MKRTIGFILTLVLLATMISSPINTGIAQENATLSIAYQYGIAYLPLIVMKDQKLIEKYYPNVEVNWQVLSSSLPINEGLITGNIDVGAMGVAPAITGIMKGIPCKIFSALSSQPQVMMTNNPEIKSMADITPATRIAAVTFGSVQHIFIAMAAKNELGDAHAMDNNIVAMSHPDGMAALLAGSVDCQMATAPYVFMERDAGMYEITSVSKVWPAGNTFIVGVASTTLYEKNPALYQALVQAMAEASRYLTEQPQAAANSLCAGLDVDAGTLLGWLSDPACGYANQTKGIMTMASFMAEEGFIDAAPSSYTDLVYDNVTGD